MWEKCLFIDGEYDWYYQGGFTLVADIGEGPGVAVIGVLSIQGYKPVGIFEEKVPVEKG